MVKKAAQAHPNHLLRRVRQERGWSQRIVADRIGAPQDTMITRWERGNAIPSPYYTERLCQLFGMTATELGLLSEESAEESEQTGHVPGKPYAPSPTRKAAQAKPSNLPVGTVTLLFMDMVGSTRLLQELGERYADVLADYRRIVRAAFQQRNGYEVDTQGDAFFIAFARAIDAAEAAIAIQRALNLHRWPENVVVLARIGLHTGQPELASEGYIGLDVHHTARIMSAGHGGQVLLSKTTHHLVEHVLPQDMSLRDLGEYRLKDLRQPTHLFQLSGADLPSDFPPLKTLDMPSWNVPFRRNPFFTGRTVLLARLHKQLNQSRNAALAQSQALSGLGGIGKTQTAVEYAYRYRDQYRAIFWVRAASRETLVADFVALAQLLNLPGHDAQDQMQIVAAVKRWLEQHEGWLLILDNADDVPLLSDFLPGEYKGHLLLTSRSQALGRIATSIPVEKMELSEGIEFLLRRAKLLSPDGSLESASQALRISAQRLVEELDGLPLALEQAAAYIEELECTLAEYLTLFKRHRLALLKRQSHLSTDYPLTVANTWALSFTQVEQANPAAAELLRLCSFLHPDAIPEAMLSEGARELGPVLQPVASDSFLLNEAIQVLRRYSLIKRDPEERVLNVHRLVQVVLKENLDQEAKQQWAVRTVRVVNAAFPKASFHAWMRCERYLPHVQACAELIEEHRLNFSEGARLLQQAGVYQRERGIYGQAEAFLRRALTIFERILGSESPEVTSVLNDLAWLFYYQARYEQAEPLLRRALTIREQVLGSEHPETASTLNNLAWLYSQQSRYTQAEPLFQRALDIREQALGTHHPETATTVNGLGMLYVFQGKNEQAVPLLRRALAIREQMLEPSDPDVAESLNNLAMVYCYLDKYEQSEPLFQRALNIREHALGPEHPDVAQSLDNLATLFRHQGKLAQAEPLQQRAFTIYEQALGPEHPDTAIALHNLAQLYQSQGRYEQAETHYQRALPLLESLLGLEHPRVVRSLHSLAQLYVVQGKYELAEPLFERAIKVGENTFGQKHSETASIRADYTEFLLTMQGKSSITDLQETISDGSSTPC